MGEVYKYLNEQKEAIKEDAKRGDKAACDIIAVYKMHYDCPADPGAQGVLMALSDERRASGS